jgi:hypothetical protein
LRLVRLKAGDQISGETEACSIHVDSNGDLQEPESSEHSDRPSPILNAKLQGHTLTFEEKDDDDDWRRTGWVENPERSSPDQADSLRTKVTPVSRW